VALTDISHVIINIQTDEDTTRKECVRYSNWNGTRPKIKC